VFALYAAQSAITQFFDISHIGLFIFYFQYLISNASLEYSHAGGSNPPLGAIFTDKYNNIDIAQFLLAALHTHRTVFPVLVGDLAG
jgi:hypothetical protein